MMKFFSANLETLRELYIDQLKHMLCAEKQITKGLPKMRSAATDSQLQDAFQSHLQETEVQVQRLEEILRELCGEADEKRNKGIAALIVEGDDLIKDATDDSIRDAGLIAAAQRVEHYEMAAYGTLQQWAQILGETRHAELLEKTMLEEAHADKLLTTISNRANPNARAA